MIRKTVLIKLSLLLLFLLSIKSLGYSQDSNFYIYLCFGQSNMEGQGQILPQDKIIDTRFKVLESVSCSNLIRTKEIWYTAVPPLCRCFTGLCPADYFGRTLVENLPSNIRIGIINVSVAGCKIELFDKVNYPAYVATAPSWMLGIINEYGGNPYGRLVEMAKLAQKDGVIKGILLHQGESNTGDTAWNRKVKDIYNNLLTDLTLSADSVPLLAGEVVNADQQGVCASMNAIIDILPNTIPTAHVISSKGCSDTTDNLHFNSAGYRELGKRYAFKLLSLPGYISNEYYEAECSILGNKWQKIYSTSASNSYFVSIQPGLNSILSPPTDSAGFIQIPVNIKTDTSYYIYARIYSITNNDDSFWVKVDTSTFQLIEGWPTGSWQWVNLGKFKFNKGKHNITMAYCEDGAKFDKICISQSNYPPSGMGYTALNICNANNPTETSAIEGQNENRLFQNNPNPCTTNTEIRFEISNNEFVSLKILSVFGKEIIELAGKNFTKGIHSVNLETNKLKTGNYLYVFKTNKFCETRKMVVE